MLPTKFRTQTCGDLTSKEVDKKVSLVGWVDSVRDYGPLTFINLRDRYGITQFVVESEKQSELKSLARSLNKEDVVQCGGVVRLRPKNMANPAQKTGTVEVVANTLVILNKSLPLPLDEKVDSGEEIRLKYRYLDLRRTQMQNNIVRRSTIVKAARDYLSELDFADIETPILAKSTPEGARDYLVPSRVNPGQFYALPQSPQLFKQLLMVSGFDRYYQIARCFRDEDLRADRQPEFTQVDIEMSFIDEEDIFKMTEGLVQSIFSSIGQKIKTPFPKISYQEAMDKYGSDKPDTRFGLELINVTEISQKSECNLFKDAIKSGGIVKCINAVNGSRFSRKEIDAFTDLVTSHGAKGLAWLKFETELDGPVSKFFSDALKKDLIKKTKAKKGDLLLFVADQKQQIVNTTLGYLRVDLAHKLKLIPKNSYDLLWVVDFPLLEYDEENKRYGAVHHPFTSPKNECMNTFDKNPDTALAKAYDIVLNGSEIGGGSIRIHNQEVQKKMFKTLGISDDEAKAKFGFLLDAFKYGAPPHGGIALGLDRICAILTGNESIREVIAFPKNKQAKSLMEDAPSSVSQEQLDELKIRLK